MTKKTPAISSVLLTTTILLLAMLVVPTSSQTRAGSSSSNVNAGISVNEGDGDVNERNMVEYWDDPKCFESTEELRQAVARYQSQNVYDSYLAKKYGWPINSWCVSNIQDFSNLFSSSSEGNKHHRYFDEPLEDWDMSHATDLSGMFQNCHWFNQPLSKWDTTSVKTMQRMFAGARNFNQRLDGWRTESVVDMSYMFLHAFAFGEGASLAHWNIRNVQNMEGMFRDARSFDDQQLKWDIQHVANTKYMVSEIAGVSLNLRGQQQ